MMEGILLRDLFYKELEKIQNPKVIEIGSRAWYNLPPRYHKHELLSHIPTAFWLGVDMLDEDGIDAIHEAHYLSKIFPANHFDAIICIATLEHIARPWIIVNEMAKITKSGGLVYVETHNAFPIHLFPNDYFRFTIQGLEELFCKDHGWKTLEGQYISPVKIVPVDPLVKWSSDADAFLNVSILAQRI